MKRQSLLVGLALVALVVSGCSQLLPKRVEFFQSKVKAVPEVSEKARETQRQAAQFVADKTEVAQVAATAEGSSPAVTAPLNEAHVVAEGLSTSLGPPEDLWKKEAVALAQKLREQKADYEARIESYRKKVEPLEGKKVEGTGKISLPYFTYVGLIIGLALLVVLAVKILAMIYPPVGAGYTGLRLAGRVGSKVLARGLSELTEGGENFKNWLKEKRKEQEDVSIDDVLAAFRSEHRGAQSRDVQDIIRSLTK